MPRPSGSRTRLYYALTVPGLEDMAAAELAGSGAQVVETFARVDRRDDIVLFRAKDAAAALKCGLLEDVFALVLDAATPPIRSAPKRLAAAVDGAAFERARLEHHAVRPKQRGRSYKVVARVAGRQPFRREDVETAFERAIGGFLSRWVPVRGAAALEVWVHLIGDRTIAGVRLSGDELAQRTYKRAHLPASLKPVVARALVTLSEPRPDDVVVDPMAGAGTILRERAEAGRARLILGGDIDSGALDAARENVRRYARLARWDATRLPLRDASVDAIIVNPPYGRQHEAIRGLESLYVKALREAARVLRPGGRCVVLTGEPALLQRLLPKQTRITSRRRLLLRGLPVTAFVIVRG